MDWKERNTVAPGRVVHYASASSDPVDHLDCFPMIIVKVDSVDLTEVLVAGLVIRDFGDGMLFKTSVAHGPGAVQWHWTHQCTTQWPTV